MLLNKHTNASTKSNAKAPQNNYRQADINQSFQQQTYDNTPEESFEENNSQSVMF